MEAGKVIKDGNPYEDPVIIRQIYILKMRFISKQNLSNHETLWYLSKNAETFSRIMPQK